MKFPWMKVLGIALPIASAGIAIISGKLEDKKLDDKVSEKIAEALSEKSE